MDLEFDLPPTAPAFFYPEQFSSEFFNPSAGQSTTTLPSQVSTSNAGRLWPSIHQQGKAQQQLIQPQCRQCVAQPSNKQPSRSNQDTNTITEEKISQLNSMRQTSASATAKHDKALTSNTLQHSPLAHKDEEDMDEDERLLASEEGKRLSSKERRQLRNKVSARAFRSRRKG